MLRLLAYVELSFPYDRSHFLADDVLKASGDLGSPILQALIDSKAFEVTVLTRKSSTAQFPTSVRVLHVDYSSVPDLTVALTGQDAVVSALAIDAMDTQLPLVEASVAAGVKRFVPSEFGADTDNPNASKLPVYQPKIAVHQALQGQAAASPDFTYTLICNGVFLDWALAYGFLLRFDSESPPFYDGGDRPFSTTTLASVGQAVVGVLRHVDETRNRVVYVHDLVTTQRKILSIAQRIAPDRKWNPVDMSTNDTAATSREKYAQGMTDMESSMGFLCRAIFGEGYGGEFQNVDNELLGIGFKTDADLEELVRAVLSRSASK